MSFIEEDPERVGYNCCFGSGGKATVKSSIVRWDQGNLLLDF